MVAASAKTVGDSRGLPSWPWQSTASFREAATEEAFAYGELETEDDIIEAEDDAQSPRGPEPHFGTTSGQRIHFESPFIYALSS